MSEPSVARSSAGLRRRPRLRTILLLVNLLILMLPLGGIAILHLAENELIRSTEAQLIAQGAHVREAYRIEFLKRTQERGPTPGSPNGNTPPGIPLPAGWQPQITSAEAPDAILPRLDISQESVRSAEPDSVPADHQAEPVAALVGAELTPALQAAGRTTLTGIRVVDATGVVVATTRAELGHTMLAREEVRRSLAGETLSLLRKRSPEDPTPPLGSISRGQRYRVIVALPVIESGRVLGAVVLSRTPLDIQKALFLSRRAIFIGAGVLLAVVALVSTLTAFTIVRPMNKLIEQTERVGRGEKRAVVLVKEPGTYEVARLSLALSGMATTLEERAEYIRTLAMHVSHEFKTPLTTIRGSVELLREHSETMTQGERERFLSNLSDACGRLEHLVQRLLDLARADVLRPGDELADVRSTVESAVRRFHEGGLQIEVAYGDGVHSVRMSEEALSEIVSCLLDNARQHGGEGVRVRVSTRLRNGPSGRIVELRFSDDGRGISEANAGRIFTPFFTTARDRGGSGLGLSIVKSLVEAHGGSIVLERTMPGAAFVILVPAAIDS